MWRAAEVGGTQEVIWWNELSAELSFSLLFILHHSFPRQFLTSVQFIRGNLASVFNFIHIQIRDFDLETMLNLRKYRKRLLKQRLQNRLRKEELRLREGGWMEQRFTINLILIGDRGAGKTSYVDKLVKKTLKKRRKKSTSVSIRTYTTKCQHGFVRFRIWDTPGELKPGDKGLQALAYRRADGVLVMYDTTDPKSTVSLQKWEGKVNLLAPRIPVVVVGNKTERKRDRRVFKQDIRWSYRSGQEVRRTAVDVDISVKRNFRLRDPLLFILRILFNEPKLWFLPLRTIIPPSPLSSFQEASDVALPDEDEDL